LRWNRWAEEKETKNETPKRARRRRKPSRNRINFKEIEGERKGQKTKWISCTKC